MLAFKYALREMRAGFGGFYIFLACLALGVGSIATVNTVSQMMAGALSSEGRMILGGDIEFSLTHRHANHDELDWLENLGQMSQVASIRTIARKPDFSDQTLIFLKAVDANYPLYGTIELEGQNKSFHNDIHQAIDLRDGQHGVVVGEELLGRLGLALGDDLRIGALSVQIRAIIKDEPDGSNLMSMIAPRVILSQEALKSTDLIKKGSLINWFYRIKLDDSQSSDQVMTGIIDSTKAKFEQSGFEIRSRANAAPGLRNNIDRFSQFLSLVGLISLIAGGVGISNAVHAFLASRYSTIAVLKCVGASTRFIFSVYGFQVLILALIGSSIGLGLGLLLPWASTTILTEVFGFAINASLYPSALMLALVFGLLTTLTFSIGPLFTARLVPIQGLFRSRITPPEQRLHWQPVIAGVAAFLIISALAISLSDNRTIALLFLGSTVISFAILRLVAIGIMAIAKKLPRGLSAEWRIALTNIGRTGSATPSVVLSLGLGLTLLVALTQIDSNLRYQITSNLPEQAPSFFFVDIQNYEVEDFKTYLSSEIPESIIETVPMMRGRFVKFNGTPVSEIKVKPDSQWALRGDRGLTYSEVLPKNSTLIEGEWWPENYDGPLLVSFEKDIADALGMKLGDTVTINVLGREVTAEVANFREVKWESLGINFVMVFSPNALKHAPHTFLATLTYNDKASDADEKSIFKPLAEKFPSVIPIRIKDVLETVSGIIAGIANAIGLASIVALLSSILVLGGALAATHEQRIYDAVILKTLGARRIRILKAFILEYGLLGLITGVFALFSGSAIAFIVITQIMQAEFVFYFLPAILTLAGAISLTITFGLIGTWSALGFPIATKLRDL